MTPASASPELAPELSCRALTTLLLYFEHQHGRARLEELHRRSGASMPLEFLVDPKNFVSFDFVTRYVDLLAEESGDADFARKGGLYVSSPAALGFVYYMLRALGSPRLVYEQVVSMGASFNRIGRFEIESIADDRLVLHYHSSRPEPNRRICDVRIGQFASFPTIWGLPAATVRERQCQIEGAHDCVYDVTWVPVGVRPPLMGLVGGALGAAAGWLAFATPLGLATALGVGAFAGGSTALALAYRARANRQRDAILTQSKGLEMSMADLHARFAEIRQLNQTLEQKVEDRTKELSVATTRLKAALDKQVELDRMKTHFFQNISHELRTPLTLILAPLDTIAQDEQLDAQGRMQLDIMRRSAVRLLGLINSLLDLSKLDAGKLRLALDDVDPALVVRQLVETAAPLARQRRIELKFTSHGKLPLVPLDADKFEKSVLNLVSNALKFTGADPSRPAEVEVTAEIVDAELRIRVRDTGIGIPDEEQQNVFTRFHQVEGGDERRFGGTGIGLALVKELVEFHCGRVQVDSKVGEGSTFTLAFPTSREAYPEDRLDRRRARAEVAVERRSESERAKLAQLIANPADLALADIQPTVEKLAPAVVTTVERPRVLVADDNRDMLSYLATILAREYDVVTASDGEEALQAAQRTLPQVIVSDVMMPKKNGYALVKDLKRDPATRSIPVILVTAKTDIHQKVSGLEVGADDYLTKPFNFLELRARIRNLLRTRALERSLTEKNDYLAKLNFDLVLSKKEVFLQTIEALSFALEAKDVYTHGHSRRVALLSTELARSLALSELEVERVRISAVLHDIGKLGIPEHILRKEDFLEGPEREVIERHPEIGASILESVKDLADVSRCILYHHEKFDGTGYPSRKKAFEIPLESRIISVADTYDAMTSDRPYRKGLGHLRAIGELKDFSGSQFDPEVVKGFLRLYEARPPVFPEFPSVFAKKRA